jgi:hypothetical protein
MILLFTGYTILAFILVLGIVIYWKFVRSQKRVYDAFRAQGIPGEPFIPVFGQIFDQIRASKENRGVEYFYELSQKHGYCFLLNIGPLTRLVLLEPELIADFLSRSKAEYY